ncbi:MAG: type I restriction endonuclease subunit R [Anaerolineales bacterium]|jgi:type I restriction enzyme R subunit|nr:type I restriction endonuclease subunit R [Anaerolineales bacterium]
MTTLPTYNEELRSQIPAARLLVALGYQYLSPAQALALRGGSERNVLLSGVLENWLKTHNRIPIQGQEHSFSDAAIHEALRRIAEVDLHSGLTRANEQLYDLLTLGISLPYTHAGDTRHYSLHYVDWQQPENNVFHVSEEFSVERERSHQTRRPDIVCFVNGIPFAVIECKRPDLQTPDGGLPYEEAISQHLRNQKEGEIRPLFAYSQLLLALSTNHAAYATTATEKKFWATWKEENEAGHEARVRDLVNAPLAPELDSAFYDWREHPEWVRRQFPAGAERLPTEQDRSLVSLLDPKRLLELSYQFLVFDGGNKKVARYQQYFAVKATLERVAALNAQGERTGGVIWHTTGSGKSLTMVMLAKALSLHPNVRNPRVILVTDRINLDQQIFKTFRNCGKNVVQARSGRHLIELVQSEKADIIATVIDKFETVADEKVRDPNANVFVLVDESHRSQYGLIHSKMRQVFSRACYIGFTGTPLTKGEKSTALKFGSFIHKYPMRQAVEDKAVVPLLYEGRMVELEPNQAQLDRWFDRHTANLNEDQKADLKRKMSREDVVSDSDRRIMEIAYNLSEHFARNFKDRRAGVKAMLAASSKQVALRYKKYLDQAGLLTSDVVISAPDTREGHEDADSENIPEVQAFWRRMMERFGTDEVYNREIVADFGRADGVEMLIVVDKLLVGFDEPRNTVLYIDKPLKDHAILQAIARVNRLFEGKEFGYVIDYRGILGELNQAIQTYDALADFDSEDVAGTIADVAAEIEKLPQRHSDLWAVFRGVATDDTETLERFLAPEDQRQVFYDALTAFARGLKVALASTVFYETTPEARIRTYKNDLKKFHNLRMSVKIRYAEAIDFRDYEQKIRKLLDDHIDAQGVKQLTAEVEIFDAQAFDEAVAGLSTPRARAESILNHLKRTALERMETDPAYYRDFSQMIEDTLKAIEQERLGELEALEQAQSLRQQETSGYRQDVPGRLRSLRDAPAFYGVIRETLASRLDGELMAEMAARIEAIIEHSKIRDWVDNPDVLNAMRNAIDGYLYELESIQGIRFSDVELDEIIEQVIDIARKRA